MVGGEVQERRAPGRRTSSLHMDVSLLAFPAIRLPPLGSINRVLTLNSVSIIRAYRKPLGLEREKGVTQRGEYENTSH